MDEYKEHLRRLAVHDDALVSLLLGEEDTAIASALDTRTAALARVAATIAIDAATSSFQHAVAHAIAAGATPDEIVATLEAVTPVTGPRESGERRSAKCLDPISSPTLSRGQRGVENDRPAFT